MRVAPPRTPSRRMLALRGGMFAIAVGLAVAGVYMIVINANESKSLDIGVVLGLWGALLGAFAVVGSRSNPAVAPPEPSPAPPPAAAPAAPPPTGRELDVRTLGELQRIAVANAIDAARREFRAELEEMLRREVQAGLAREIAGLRAEVTALRNELVEKVGGQLRLERIETTRLIGSDLEALQHELRQLREIGGAREHVGAVTADVQDAEIIVERVAAPAPDRAEPTVPVSIVKPQRAPEPPQRVPPPQPVVPPAPAKAEPAKAEPAKAEPAKAEPAEKAEPAAKAAASSADPFAALPRLTPFTEFELDPIPPTPPAPPRPPPADTAAARAGRHASGSNDAPSRGRRHRADDDGGDDVLARILARESGR